MKYKTILFLFVTIILILQILIFAQLATNPTNPQPTITQQKMHCLELGSDTRYYACLRLIK